MRPTKKNLAVWECRFLEVPDRKVYGLLTAPLSRRATESCTLVPSPFFISVPAKPGFGASESRSRATKVKVGFFRSGVPIRSPVPHVTFARCCLSAT